MLPNGLKGIVDEEQWKTLADTKNIFPYFTKISQAKSSNHEGFKFICIELDDFKGDYIQWIKESQSEIVLVANTNSENTVKELRQLYWALLENEISAPVILKKEYSNLSKEDLVLYASTDLGSLFNDGFGDGIWINSPLSGIHICNRLSFGILQACRTRISKTEYISCPSCGRTLFDLQETTSMIRKRTDHLKGIKIAIMGCIVNGPGEMADAHYGYVGSGVDKITLYRNKEVVKRNIPSDGAVDELIALISEDGNWIDNTTN
ncbi:MAG: flavodoxin-dependent (E)-4-hydroxy-3-methylbut-2-enyl-diphosphate synthase [Bacteroidetes bacterium]|nr:flavodoxin-dependent (E)-4-hydroxy-3-methylbut-2-enyl-diphosphate synthase [Bacteroidota bacterium]